MCFHFIYRRTRLQKILPITWRLYAISAARSMWAEGALLTIYFSTTRRRKVHPHLLARSFLTSDIDSPKILTGLDVATATNQQIKVQTLDEHTHGVHRRGSREVFRTKGFRHHWNGYILLQQTLTPKKVRKRYENIGNIGRHTDLVY